MTTHNAISFKAGDVLIFRNGSIITAGSAGTLTGRRFQTLRRIERNGIEMYPVYNERAGWTLCTIPE